MGVFRYKWGDKWNWQLFGSGLTLRDDWLLHWDDGSLCHYHKQSYHRSAFVSPTIPYIVHFHHGLAGGKSAILLSNRGKDTENISPKEEENISLNKSKVLMFPEHHQNTAFSKWLELMTRCGSRWDQWAWGHPANEGVVSIIACD